jgi:RES domain-containing protein
MRLWRLSSVGHARDFTGGYGLFNNGRWNTIGRPVTYCATVPSLAALEKRVHVTDAADLPPQALVAYDVPDDIAVRNIEISALPKDWASRETHTQQVGNEWLDDGEEAILMMPSVVMPVADAVDRNALINHRRSDTTRITIAHVIPFTLDPRLFRP